MTEPAEASPTITATASLTAAIPSATEIGVVEGTPAALPEIAEASVATSAATPGDASPEATSTAVAIEQLPPTGISLSGEATLVPVFGVLVALFLLGAWDRRQRKP